MSNHKSRDALVDMQRYTKAAFWQKHASLSEADRQAKWAQYLKWVALQATGSKIQLSSTVPQKRYAARIGLEPGSKRPSVVGLPSCCCICLV